jgi:hypothetical protein
VGASTHREHWLCCLGIRYTYSIFHVSYSNHPCLSVFVNWLAAPVLDWAPSDLEQLIEHMSTSLLLLEIFSNQMYMLLDVWARVPKHQQTLVCPWVYPWVCSKVAMVSPWVYPWFYPWEPPHLHTPSPPHLPTSATPQHTKPTAHSNRVVPNHLSTKQP